MRKVLFVVCAVAVLGVVFAAPASAQVGGKMPFTARGPVDKSTYLTFSGPISLPGLSLPAGTYVFRLPSWENSPNVVQVLSEDRKTVYAIVSTIPINRAETSHETEIVFKEAATDTPAKVAVWFYPDENTGREFLYFVDK